MKIMLDNGAKMPTRAHPYDAGLDLYAIEDVQIPSTNGWPFFDYATGLFMPTVGRATIDTGVHVEIPEGYVGFIKSKSGLLCNHGIVTDGTIDSHYIGPIKVCLFNHSLSSYEVKAGDKIAQLVIVPCMLPELELVDSLDETDRGDNGFGSTGR